MDFSDISPDGWQNLMQFGLATMAAGGQPGATTLGSIGQGGLAAMQANRQQQLQRSQMGLQNAQTNYYGSETRQKNIATNLQLQQLNVQRMMRGMPPLDANGNDPMASGGDLSMPGKQNAPPGAAPSGMAYAPSAGTSHQGPSDSPVSNIYPAPQGGSQGAPQGGSYSQSSGDPEVMPGLPLSVTSGRVAPSKQQAAMMAQLYDQAGLKDQAQHFYDLAYKTEPGFQLTPGYGEQYIPNSSADPRYKGAVAGSEAWAKVGPNIAEKWRSPMDVRSGVVIDPSTGKVVFQAPVPVQHYDKASDTYSTDFVMPARSMGAQPGAQPTGQGPQLSPGMSPGGAPTNTGAPVNQTAGGPLVNPAVPVMSIPHGPGPGLAAETAERGKGLGEAGHEYDEQATAAVQSNFLLDQMRAESKTWAMGKFADFEGNARAYLQAAREKFGLPASPEDQQKLADFQAFNKNATQLTTQATRAVSSRAAFQEMQLIQHALPSPTMSEKGFNQVADQLQAVNDFSQAKAAEAQKWRTANGSIEGFNVDFNKRLTPATFLVHRMDSDALASMTAKLQTTPEGRATLRRLMGNMQYAQERGLFN